MENNLKKFDALLKNYTLGRINANILHNHICQLFSDLLDKYKFRELEYLKIYPFLSELQDKDLYEEPFLKEKIQEINNILNGKKTFSYGLWMKLEKGEINPIIKIWNKYKEKGTIPFEDLELLQEQLCNIRKNLKTVEDIYLEKLLTILIGVPTVNDNFYTYNLLYAEDINQSNIYEETERLIEQLSGKKPVHVLLKYMGGKMYNECIFYVG